jgi:hypothetical protein
MKATVLVLVVKFEDRTEMGLAPMEPMKVSGLLDEDKLVNWLQVSELDLVVLTGAALPLASAYPLEVLDKDTLLAADEYPVVNSVAPVLCRVRPSVTVLEINMVVELLTSVVTTTVVFCVVSSESMMVVVFVSISVVTMVIGTVMIITDWEEPVTMVVGLEIEDTAPEFETGPKLGLPALVVPVDSESDVVLNPLSIKLDVLLRPPEEESVSQLFPVL